MKKTLMVIIFSLSAIFISAKNISIEYKLEFGYLPYAGAVSYTRGDIDFEVIKENWFTTLELVGHYGPLFVGGSFNSIQYPKEITIWAPISINYGVKFGLEWFGLFVQYNHHCQHPVFVCPWYINHELSQFSLEGAFTTISVGFRGTLER